MKQNQPVIQKSFESIYQEKIRYKLILLFCISFSSFGLNAQPTVSSVGVPANGTYITDQNLDFTVNFSEPVTVVTSGGMPYIAITLNTGGTVNASYESGSGTSAIVFRYIVAEGNADNNGVGVGVSIMPNGGSLKDGIGNNATLTLNNIGSTVGVLVDAVAPTVSSVGVPANDTYTASQNLDFTVNFSEAVNVVTTGGTPFIPLILNTGTVHAAYLSGSGTTSLVFRYTVVLGNEAGTGIAIDIAITPNGGTIKDLAGNGATLTLNGVPSASGVLVDALAPTVSSVAVPPDDTYITDQNLDFMINFSEVVNVNTTGGTPYISVTLGTGGLVHASYLSGSGTTALDFRYTIVAGNGDNNGITLGTAITANGGTIKDATGNMATPTLNGIGNTSGVLVDAVSPTISSVGAPSNAIYTEGQNLDFTVHFTEAVTVVTSGGMPYIPITLNTGGTVNASYQSGSGSIALVFRYTVVAGNEDNNGVFIGPAITANGGTLKDAVGNNATLTLNSIGSTAGVLVDAIIPTVSSVGVPSNTTYAAGQNLDFTVNFSEAITVVTAGGTPYIPVTLNTGGIVNASYQSGTGTSALTFRYAVVAGNADNDGVAVGTAIIANGGTLKDAGGNSATLALNNIGVTTNVLVDAIAPTILSVSSATANGTYKVGDAIAITVTFSKAVFVTGTPTLAMNSGGTALYSSGNSGTILTFTYTVSSGNISADLDYSSISSLSLSGGTIKDVPGNNAALTLPTVGGASSLGGQKNIVVDGIIPIVLSVGVPANATYIGGQNLDFTVNFSESVTVVTTGGTPFIPITLNTGGTVNATYQSGSGTTALMFRYTVVNGNGDSDGVSTGASITANGGTLKDASGNNATLTLNSIANTSNVLVDAIVPTVSSVGVPANATYTTGQNLSFIVNFSEVVNVVTTGGTPSISITLNTGGTVNASYQSGSGSSTLVFRYIVVSGNADNDGVSVGVSINTNGGTLKDGAGNTVVLTLNSIGNTTGVLVNTLSPGVISVSLPANATYISGQYLDFTVTFSQAVNVSATGGVPYLPLTLTSGSVNATYQSGTGTSSLLFRYVVVDGNNDTNGIGLGASIALNGGTIKNGSLLDAILTLNGVGSTSGIIIDAVAPTVTITSTANNPTDISPIPVSINFSEPVSGFVIGDIVVTNGTAGNFTGSGTTYSVDITPVSSGIVKINIAGGTAQDIAGNNNIAATEFNITYSVAVPSVVILSSPAMDTSNQPIALSLTWNASSGASSYTVQVSTFSDFSSTTVNQSGIQNTNHGISGLSYSTKYYWRVKAVNTIGTSDWSTIWNFTTTTNVGVEEMKSLSDYKLYPNPVGGILTIENPGELSTIMDICTMNGNIVMTKVLHNKIEKIDLSTLSAGLCYIKLTNQRGSKIVKIIKL